MTQYELFYFLFRNKWLILAGVLAGAIAAGAAFKLKPHAYRSEAKLLVRYVSDTMIVDPAVSAERVLTPGRPSDTLINTEVEILTSAEIASATAKALADAAGRNADQAAEPMTVRQIERSLGVQVANNSSTIQLSFDGPSPEAAQRALDELIKAYLAKHQEVHRDPGAFEFISRQTEEMRTLVNNAEDELRRAKNEAGIMALAESRAMVMTRIQDLDRAIGEHESSLVGTRARMQVLSEQIARASVRPPTGVASGQTVTVLSPEMEDALRQLADLQRREAELLRVYTPDSVPVQSVRQQIDTLRKATGQRAAFVGSNTNGVRSETLLARTTREIMAADHAMYEAEEAALLAQLAELRKQRAAAQIDSKRIEASEAQILRLERTREMYDAKFRYFSQRLESARVDGAMDASKVQNIPLVQTPTLPDRPTMKGLKKLLAMILAACMGCSLALSYAREYIFDHSIRHPHEIPRLLHVPLLATLPRLPHALNGAPPADKSELSSRASQALDSACELVAQLIRDRLDRKERTLFVGFTAPHAGAGVTTVAGRVAGTMRFSGIKNVLLTTVQADGQFTGKLLGSITRAAVAQESQAPDAAGSQEKAMAARDQNLTMIAYSSSSAISPRVLEEFNRQDYDCVLFDLPPFGESDVTVRLLPRLDGVVLMLEALRTPRSQAVACMHQFEQLRCQVYGAVLNKFTSPVPSWLAPPTAADTPSPSAQVG